MTQDNSDGEVRVKRWPRLAGSMCTYIEGHYEVNDLSYDRGYMWAPTRTTRPVRAAGPTTRLC
jgi:hypothetical protein